MQSIRKKLTKKYGYDLDDFEILALYRQGMLSLTDKQENELLEYFDM